jgi:hypothetical protein
VRSEALTQGDDKSVRFASLRLEIRDRLRDVCAGWPEDALDALVSQIATLTLKYQGRATPTPTEVKSLGRAMADMEDAIEHRERRKGTPEDGGPPSSD